MDEPCTSAYTTGFSPIRSRAKNRVSARVAQRDATGHVDPLVVGTPVPQSPGHSPDHGLIDRPVRAIPENTGYAAHWQVLSLASRFSGSL